MTNEEEILKKFDEESPLAFHGREWARNFLIEALKAQDKIAREAVVEKIKGMKKPVFCEAFDNDGHRYQIPIEKIDEWREYCEIPSEDERSWDTPEFSERIDGMPIAENYGYNKALDEIISSLIN